MLSNKPSGSGTASTTNLGPTPAALPSPLQVEDITIYPYDLVKNPFLNKGHIVQLDARSYPTLLNGNFLEYRFYTGAPSIVGNEFVGVRFEKMLDTETALFEVLGYQQGGFLSNATAYGGMERIGQLVVLVSSGSPQLDPQVFWNVEPLGTFDGSNAFGATVSVPVVRFYGYWKPPQQLPPKLEGTAKLAVGLVRGHIQPTDYLMSLSPSFDQSEWWPVNDESFCDGCWEVSYHVRVLNSGSKSVDFVNPSWQVNVKTKTVKIVQKYSGNVPVADDGSTSKFFNIVN
jgi:hypothetical protein